MYSKSSEQDPFEIVDDRLNGVPQTLPVRAPLEGGHHHAQALLVDLEQFSGVGETINGLVYLFGYQVTDEMMNDNVLFLTHTQFISEQIDFCEVRNGS